MIGIKTKTEHAKNENMPQKSQRPTTMQSNADQKQRKENKEDEERAAETLRYHQEQIAEKLLEQKHMLEKAIEKIEGGLTMVREKYAEERLYRMKNDQ